MCNGLLSEEKYEELLDGRTKPLTTKQQTQLDQVEQLGFVLNRNKRNLPDDSIEDVFSMLRRKQIRILKNENTETWQKFLDSLPDVVISEINIP